MNMAAERYLTDRVMTATPAELTAMLFDGAVGAVRSALAFQEQGEFLAAIPKITKAAEIVLELKGALNHDAGGELASTLGSLYTWCYQRLLHASLHRDPRALKDTLDVLVPLAESWRQACLTVAA